MMTPTAAKELWCPMVRYGDGANVDAKYQGKRVPNSAKCIAQECAMWRWTPNTKYMPVPVTGGHSRPVMHIMPPETGYCGLAGRQEVCP